MPRHPPNAQNNKQQTTHEQNQEQNTHQQERALSNQFAEIITVRCSRPLYSSQPTHPHPHPTTHTRQQNTGQATRAHYPRTPTACHPHTHQARAGAPTTSRPPQPQDRSSPPQQACLLHQAPDKPTNPGPSPHRQDTNNDGQPPSLPREQPPRPARTHTAQTTNSREATPTQLPILRKEVIQPHLPVRLPCYDFVPITSPTFDRSP